MRTKILFGNNVVHLMRMKEQSMPMPISVYEEPIEDVLYTDR